MKSVNSSRRQAEPSEQPLSDLGTVASNLLRSAHPQGLTLHPLKAPTAAGEPQNLLPSPGPEALVLT